MTGPAIAGTVRVLGQRGPIVPRFASRTQASRAFFVSPNLVASQGRLFERDRFGQFRQLFFSARTGQLVNFVEPGTARQLGSLLARNLNSLGGVQRQLAEMLLNRLGMSPSPQAPTAQLPPTSIGTPVVGPQCGVGPGPHGNTNCGGGIQGGGGGQPSRSTASAPFSEGVAQGGLCRDLHQSICSAGNVRNEEQQIGNAVRNLVQDFVKRQGISIGTFSSVVSNIVRNPTNPQFKAIYQNFFAHFASQVPAMGGLFESVKNLVAKGVQNMPLSDSTKQQMTARLATIQIKTAPDFNDPADVQGFAEGCGPDGMAPGAFAKFAEKQVVVCPGLIMRALALGGTAELEHHLMHAIGHECTHHIGADIIRNDRGQAIGQSPFRPEFQKALGCYAQNFRDIDPVRMGGEIAADIGAAKALVERLRGYSPEEAFKFIKASVSPLCGSQNDGVHPSNRFRINVVLGQDPDIAALLGCSQQGQVCTLSGQQEVRR